MCALGNPNAQYHHLRRAPVSAHNMHVLQRDVRVQVLLFLGGNNTVVWGTHTVDDINPALPIIPIV